MLPILNVVVELRTTFATGVSMMPHACEVCAGTVGVHRSGQKRRRHCHADARFFLVGNRDCGGIRSGGSMPKLREEFGPIIREASARAREMASEMTADFADKVQRSQDQQVGTAWTETQERRGFMKEFTCAISSSPALRC